jgi:hypothetical protein
VGGAEALAFGIETAEMDDAVTVIASAWVDKHILGAVVWSAEHAALLIGAATTPKAHFAPATGLGHNHLLFGKSDDAKAALGRGAGCRGV